MDLHVSSKSQYFHTSTSFGHICKVQYEIVFIPIVLRYNFVITNMLGLVLT